MFQPMGVVALHWLASCRTASDVERDTMEQQGHENRVQTESWSKKNVLLDPFVSSSRASSFESEAVTPKMSTRFVDFGPAQGVLVAS